MLDFLFNLFKKTNALANISQITNYLCVILDIFEQEHKQDDNAYNAAIDTTIEILKTYKKPVTTTSPKS